jgi:hypothetical protein
MELLELPGWRIQYDRAATEWAYLQAPDVGPAACQCNACQNWVASRSQILPVQFLQLLAKLGIPPNREAEVYHNGRNESGLHSYGGWYHFVGKVLFGERECSAHVAFGPLAIWFHSQPQLVPPAFQGKPVVQLEIWTDVPWLSNIPEMK